MEIDRAEARLTELVRHWSARFGVGVDMVGSFITQRTPLTISAGLHYDEDVPEEKKNRLEAKIKEKISELGYPLTVTFHRQISTEQLFQRLENPSEGRGL